MTKKYSRIVSSVFLLFLASVLVAHIIVPDQKFSENENRFLQEFPELTLDTFTGGGFLNGFKDDSTNDFMSKFETYTTDQFPLRDSWVSMKSWAERLTGKQENNGVYLADKNTLINRLDPIDYEALDKAAGFLNTLAEKSTIPVYFGLIPSSAEVWNDRLPTGAPTADEQAAIEHMYGNLQNVTTLDMLNALTAHSDEDIYYRTDHHWTTLGAYYGYVAMMEALGETPVSIDKYTATVVSDSFYGTTYSSSGVRWLPADVMTTYVPEDGIEVTANKTGVPEAGALYHFDRLETKDKYTFFLGGNQPLVTLKTEHTDKPSVLVVRDSYSDSLAPYLTENFSEIHLVDLRYFNLPISAYAQMAGVDEIVVLYSVANFVTDINLFKLGM